MTKKTVELGALVRSSLSAYEDRKALLEGFLDTAPEWSPEKYNTVEPVNIDFEVGGLERALELWNRSLFWRRVKPRISASVLSGNSRTHGVVRLSVPRASFDVELSRRVVAMLDSLFRVDISYVHPRSEFDTEDLTYYALHIMPLAQGLNTHRLREGLPWGCWGMYFGQPYRELFGGRLDSCPASLSEQAGGLRYLQLTEEMKEVCEEPGLYRNLAEAAMQHLDSGAFVGTASEDLAVPPFELGAESSAGAQKT